MRNANLMVGMLAALGLYFLALAMTAATNAVPAVRLMSCPSFGAAVCLLMPAVLLSLMGKHRQ